MTAITYTDADRAANLRRAQDVCRDRARLRREVAGLSRIEGCRRVAELLRHVPSELETVEIFDLLCWIRLIGPSQARGILRTHRPISENRRLRSLTPRQRIAIASHLTTSAGRRV
jgi:hypothetical protein